MTLNEECIHLGQGHQYTFPSWQHNMPFFLPILSKQVDKNYNKNGLNYDMHNVNMQNIVC